MVKVIRTCPRCGRLVDEKEYNVWLDNPELEETGCEYCISEYEAILERQKEERRMFWRGDSDE